MKTDPNSERLLGDVLLDEAFRAGSLALLVQEARRHQTRRHRQRVGVVVLVLIAAAFGLWASREERKSVIASQPEDSFSKLEIVRSSPLARNLLISHGFAAATVKTVDDVKIVTSETAPTVAEISDSELFAFLPDQPVALIRSSGQMSAIVILPNDGETLAVP